MMNGDRWSTAQKYEKEWWEIRKQQIEFDFYRKYAEDLTEQIRGIINIEPKTSILEIGSGAGGIVTYLNSDDRNAIDPLEDFYSSVPNFQKQRDQKVKYQKAKAENLPYENDRFDFIICDNVLDHCDDVDIVISEMDRVLHESGKIYLRVNLYTFWGKLIRSLIEALKIDPGHPHTFTKRSITMHLTNGGLKPIKIEANGFVKTWVKEIRSGKIKELLKALSLSTPNKTLLILAKRNFPQDI